MDALLTSTLTVALAEIGDKTQLLSLFLATRYRNKPAIIMGILAATLVNHGISAWAGNWAVQYVPEDMSRWIVGGSFILLALWLLIPDKDGDGDGKFDKYGAFIASSVLFFLAEIGDKTQIATVVLGAQYDSVLIVTIGTTLGMLIANVPVVYAGEALMRRLPMKAAHIAAALLFAAVGVVTIVS
ncbi:TMEM165/GDT1 family protein [Emcibacter nanhaiensis]|uniref:GDT1 family protein n=1 Tax=Emcibacter nanhaiensis TaxID=1505037 RepID=A0A501PG01_9PROT|nr:TMEM165/GDT1 family protein [Emcibacter nanhaiensis]TPD59105.1 TMEM165/GDT1 family protein [Emcibacter nanhaiensis]